MNTLKISGFFLTLFLFLVACSNEQASPEPLPAPEPETTAVTPAVADTEGDTENQSNSEKLYMQSEATFDDLTVVVRSAQLTSEEAVQPLENDELLVVNVSFKNNGTVDKDVQLEGKFSASDESNHQYLVKTKHSIDSAILSIPDISGVLKPGEFVDGRLIFDVKKSDQFNIKYTAGVGKEATWLVPVFRAE